MDNLQELKKKLIEFIDDDSYSNVEELKNGIFEIVNKYEISNLNDENFNLENSESYLEDFEKRMIKIIGDYSYSKFNIDFDNIFAAGLNEYQKYALKGSDTNALNHIYSNTLLYYLCCYLDKNIYKKFLKKTKEYHLYQFFPRKKDQSFFKYFPDIYLKYTFLKNKKLVFFTTKYRLFNYNKSQYYLRAYKNEGLKFLLARKICLDYVEIVITTKCSLRCKNCANLINLYNKPYHIKDDLIEKSIYKLFQSVDKIHTFRILGGEPFLNPNLKHYLDIIPYDQVDQVVIVTNGTMIIKDKELIKKIKDNHVEVEISDYGKLSRKKDELVNILEKNGLNYKVRTEELCWIDYGDIENYGNKNINKQFYYCDNRCKSILNGCLYYCPRASHGYDLDLIERKSDEYVDLINSSRAEIRKRITKLYKREKYIEACKYCKYGTEEAIKIEPAIQQK